MNRNSDGLDITHFSFIMRLDGVEHYLGGSFATGRYVGFTGFLQADEMFLTMQKKNLVTKASQRLYWTQVSKLEKSWAGLLPFILRETIEPFPMGVPRTIASLYGLYWRQSGPLRYFEIKFLLHSFTTPLDTSEQLYVLYWLSIPTLQYVLNDKNMVLTEVMRDSVHAELDRKLRLLALKQGE